MKQRRVAQITVLFQDPEFNVPSQETIPFPEPEIGVKQGTIHGILHQFDFMLLDSGNWHVILYKSGDNKNPLTSMEVDFNKSDGVQQ